LPILAVRVNRDAKFLMQEGVEKGSEAKVITAGQYLLTELNVIATYARLYLLPYGQSLDYDYPKAEGLGSGPTLISLLLIVGAAGVALVAAALRRAPVYSWGILFALGVLAPTSSLWVLPDFVFEHRMYLPL